MRHLDIFPKVLFIISLIIFAVFYGVLAGKFGWFPSSFLNKAIKQAEILFTSHAPSKSSYNTNPQIYNYNGVRAKNFEDLQPGLTLITSLWKRQESEKLKAGARLIDSKGRTLHQWQVDRDKFVVDKKNLVRREPKASPLQGAYLFPNGNLLVSLDYIGTVMVDACGKFLWRLPEFTHHSIARAEDGTFWIPAIYGHKRAISESFQSGVLGFGEKKVWLDRLLHINENGKILDDINLLNVLYKNNLEYHIVKTTGLDKDDITHLNDIEPLNPSMAEEYPIFEAGDLLVSARNLNLVFVFDPDTHKIKWYTSEPFIQQHDPDFIGGGWIGVFDNNQGYLRQGVIYGNNRIVAIQPHTNKTQVIFPTEQSGYFYTPDMGKWQFLKNGNLLLTESRTGRVAEVGKNGEILWEWVHKPVGNKRVPSVGEGTRYNLTKEDIASWDCSLIQNSKNFNKKNN